MPAAAINGFFSSFGLLLMFENFALLSLAHRAIFGLGAAPPCW